ncbi:MAG TPA: prephenate dehydrogenase/arogenate dehydrogenase family protein [Candidatus Saccharimonadales bacterium]|nr:prephenate dehydrogenase/arogenate dehydrogenase family protein [Candidatus Saccharimonadales bacterium]
MTSIGVIGFGTFGRFMCSYLKPFFNIGVYDKKPLEEEIKRFGVDFEPLEQLVRRPVIIIAVPVQAQEHLYRQIAPIINPQALVIDVSSVKMKPVELMQQFLPASCQILATHPLFGAVSGQKGIAGLTIVTWPVRVETTTYNSVKQFLEQRLHLKVLEQPPEPHDRQMAYAQALTFFIGRALERMDIPDSILKTATYQHLLDIERVIRKDSDELFRSVQAENPFAGEVREQFVEELGKIQAELRGH